MVRCSHFMVLLCTLCLTTVLFAQPLTGYKTIGGTAPDYATFAEATSSLAANGVGTGGVIFLARPGIYSEMVTVNYHVTMGSGNPIVFRNDSTQVGTVQISPNVITTGQHGVKLNGCQYVTFNGISVIDTSTGTTLLYYGYWLTNSSATQGAQHNTVTNATIRLRISTTNASYGIYQYRTATPASAAGAQSYNRYLNLKISKSFCGMILNANSSYPDIGIEVGSDSTGVNYSKRFQIGGMVNDTIGGTYHAQGIYTDYINGLSIHDADISNVMTWGGSFNPYGIMIGHTNNGLPTNIYNNRIHDLKALYTGGYSYVDGLVLNQNNSSSICRVYNNMIYNLQQICTTVTATCYTYGILCNSAGNTPALVNNTVVLNQTGIQNFTSYCLNVPATAVNDSIYNNIFINLGYQTSTTPYHLCIYNQAAAANLKSNYNCFYVPNSLGGYIGYSNGAYQATLADWQAALTPSPDLASVYGNPLLVDSLNDLHVRLYQPTSIVNNAGTPMFVTSDIDGEIRNGTTPDIGADEGPFQGTFGISFTVGGVSSPANYNFGTILTGTTSTVPVTITNTGTITLTLSTRFLPGSGRFSWTHALPATLAGSTTIYDTLLFSPTVNGTFSDTLRITHNAPGSPYNCVLSGIAMSLTGTKTIGGTNADYANFTTAVNDLNTCGVLNGGVTFLVRPGIYSEMVTVNYHATMGSGNPIVFRNDSTQVGTVQISPSVTGANQYGVKLYGCQYVTFNGISVIDTSTGIYPLSYGYFVTNSSATRGAQYCTVKNATIRLRINNSYSTHGVNQISSFNPTSSPGSQSNNSYLNLKISKVSKGVYIFGVSSYPDANTEIGSDSTGVNYANRFTIGAMANDTIGGAQSAYGIFCNNANGITIRDVDITNLKGYGNPNPIHGIYLYYPNRSTGSSPVLIYNNRINNFQVLLPPNDYLNPLSGIYLYNCTGNSDCRIYNNMIYNLQQTANLSQTSTIYLYGIYYSSYYTSNPVIANNTIVLNQAGTHNYSSCCLYLSHEASYDWLYNNIFANLSSQTSHTPYHVGISSTVASTYLRSDYNCFYIPDSIGGYLSFCNNTFYRDLASWRSASTSHPDLNSVYGNPFVMDSLANMHIRSNVPTPVASAGTPVSFVTTDIDGQTRDPLNPDIGADEGNFLVRDFNLSGSPIAFSGLEHHKTDSLMLHITHPDGVPFCYQSLGTQSTHFSYRVLDNDSLTASQDTLRIRVYFNPDSSIFYRDTLRVTLQTPYNPISIPLSGQGLGLGSQVRLPATNLNFSNSVAPGQFASLDFTVLVTGNDSLRNGRWITIPPTAPFSVFPNTIPTLPPGSWYSERVVFAPTTTGTFTAQIALVSSAENGDTLRMGISGFSQTMPVAPGLTITVNGYNALLNWTRPDTTVQNYIVYFRNSPTIPWQFLTSTTGYNATSFTHVGVIRFSPQMFYQVTAWYGGSTDEFDRIIREIPVGTPKEEVLRRLLSGTASSRE